MFGVVFSRLSSGPLFSRAAALLFFAPASLPAIDHLDGIDCSACHIAGAKATPENAYQLIAHQEDLCGLCHEPVSTASHPIGMEVTRSLPAQYPLDFRKNMTCSTCHNPHDTNPYLLRGDQTGADLCLSCHEQSFFDTMVDQGVSVYQRVHLAQTVMTTDELLDSYSLYCMGCHDESVSAPAGNQYGDSTLAHGASSMKHPIGLSYGATLNDAGYNASTTLDEHLQLPDGRMSCITCHRAYEWEHGKLAVSNGASSLCFQCHAI